MKEEFFQSLSSGGFHTLSVAVWGKENNDPIPVFCAHGLTRNGRDFDKLAAALSATRTVYCPDFPGRGRSEDLRDPMRYELSQYMADMTALIARTGAAQIDWVGTSMGGLVGLFLAAQPGSPIRRLVLNDVGPVVTKESMAGIREKLLKWKSFETVEEIEQKLRQIFAGFGALTDEDWAHMARHSVRRAPDGRLMMAYDPKIVEPMKELTDDIELWKIYDAIKAPTLVLRGENSDILAPAVAQEMTRRGPRAELVTFAGVGHAPSLMVAGQIETVAGFLGKRQISPAPIATRQNTPN